MSACDEARERIWTALDSGTEPPDAHCPACQAYAEQARRLHAMLPQALGELPQISVRAAVLARIRAEDPPRVWIPAAVFLSLGAAYGFCVWMGWGVEERFFTTAAEVPMKTAIAAAIAAAALSWTTLKRRHSHV